MVTSLKYLFNHQIATWQQSHPVYSISTSIKNSSNLSTFALTSRSKSSSIVQFKISFSFSFISGKIVSSSFKAALAGFLVVDGAGVEVTATTLVEGSVVDWIGTDILIFLLVFTVDGTADELFLAGVIGGKAVRAWLMSFIANSSDLPAKMKSKLAGLMYSLLTTCGQFGLLLECS